MNKKLKIWGRDFELKVTYDIYEGEELSQSMRDALDMFLNVSDDLLSCVDRMLLEYCIGHSNGNITEVENIFKYVMPTSVLVKRSKDKRIVVLLCAYRFDSEHGIAIVYENECLMRITDQSNI